MATKAATEAVESATLQGVARARKAPFKLGKKQLFLPNHVVTFLRPKPGQSPTTATFKVPLTFNKLDFRDYLYHVYDVEVTSVRSFINQMLPQQRALPGGIAGQWYRPRSQKLMVVDLKKPFIWPERPSEEDMEPWDHKLFSAVEDGHAKDVKDATVKASSGRPKLRTQQELGPNRVMLRHAAEELLSGKKKWVPGSWVEVEKEKAEDAVLEAAQDVLEMDEGEAETEAGAGAKVEAEALPDPEVRGTNQGKDEVKRS